MTALSNRAARIALVEYHGFTRAFARLLHYLNLLAQGFADGHEMARAARKRYPFADW